MNLPSQTAAITRPVPDGTRLRHSSRMSIPLSWVLLVVGTCGFAAVWITLSMFNNTQNSWMAVLGALDVAWMLRLGYWPRGPGRVVAALVATAVMVALANWGIIASHLGSMLGLTPWESAGKLGLHHAWTLAGLATTPVDLVWLGTGLVLAGIAGKWTRVERGSRA